MHRPVDESRRRTSQRGTLPSMLETWDSSIADLRGRPFTVQQAHASGLSTSQLHRAVRAGALRRPVRGVYLPARLPDTLALRVSALSLLVPPDAFVCDHTAAWLHAGDRALIPGDHLLVPPISCFRAASGYRLRRDGVRSGEREVASEDVMEVSGLRVTTPLRTALDVGRLSRNSDVRLHGMDTMSSLGVFTAEDLQRGVLRFDGHRGVVGLRALAPLVDGGSQSYGESALRLRWHGAHLPRPLTQHAVPGPHGSTFFLDMALPGVKLAAEYDGEAFHSTAGQRAHDSERRLWLRRLGWTVTTFRKEHVFGSKQDAEQRLRAAFADLTSGQVERRYY